MKNKIYQEIFCVHQLENSELLRFQFFPSGVRPSGLTYGNNKGNDIDAVSSTNINSK